MATLYSEQVQRSINVGSEFSHGGTETGGKLRIAYFSRNTTSATYGNVANGDTIQLCKIPKGARILDGTICREALGASVTVSVGTLLPDGTASAAALLAATDFSAAGQTFVPATKALGFGTLTTAETTITATIGGATPTGAKILDGYILYALN